MSDKDKELEELRFVLNVMVRHAINDLKKAEKRLSEMCEK